jgi:hypothetical protein
MELTAQFQLNVYRHHLFFGFCILLNIHFTSLYSLCFFSNPAWFTGHENPPNKCAKITRQKNPPVKSAVKTCQIYARLKPAEFTCRKNPPLQLTACLPENPPSPLRIPRQDPTCNPSPPPPPPPPATPSMEKGEGAGSRPGPPTHPEQVLLLSFPFHEWLHILIWHNIYIFCTERTNLKV